MSLILLPQRFLSQPQYPAQLKDTNFWRLVDIQNLPPYSSAPVTRTLKLTAKPSTGLAGTCVDFVAAGDWLSYGEDSNLHLSVQTGIAVVEMPTSFSADRATLFNTNADGSFSSGFIVTVNPDGTVFVLKQDVVGIGQTTKAVKLGGISTVVWSYNNVSGLLRIAIDGVLESFVSPQTFTHKLVTRNAYYSGSPAQASAHRQYLFALSAECDRVTNAELIAWSNDPWSVFKSPTRKIWVSTSSDVTATLSGQAVTGSQGSLGIDTSVALSGQQASFATGTLTPGAGAAVALTGQSSSFAQGSLSPVTDIALTGQSLSWSQGALSPEIGLPITGQSITGAQDSLGVSLDVGLSGQALAFSQGTIGTQGDVTVALTGIAITASQGTLSPPVPSSGGFSGPLSFGKVKPRKHRDKDREEIRKSLLAQLEEKVEELQEDVSPPEVPQAIKSQVAQIAEEYQEPSIDLKAMESDIQKVRALLKSYEEEVRRRRDEEDEELLFMFL